MLSYFVYSDVKFRIMVKLAFVGRFLIGLAFIFYGYVHFAFAKHDAAIVPHFLGNSLFWVYFIGICWWATALSFFTNILTRYSGWLAALLLVLILVFVQLKGPIDDVNPINIASVIGLMGGCIVVAEESRFRD